MKIKKVVKQYATYAIADYVCEHCEHEKRATCSDTSTLRCKNCNQTSAEVENHPYALGKYSGREYAKRRNVIPTDMRRGQKPYRKYTYINLDEQKVCKTAFAIHEQFPSGSFTFRITEVEPGVKIFGASKDEIYDEDNCRAYNELVKVAFP